MFKNFSIKNFKAFSDFQEIDLAPITLIYGPNSSGKSSIIHALMLLKQTFTRPNSQGGLVPNGEYVELGDYFSMVHGHDSSKHIEFKFSYSPTKNKQSSIPFGQSFGNTQPREYSFSYSYSGSSDGIEYGGFTYLKQLEIAVKSDDASVKSIFDIGFEASLTEKSDETLEKRVSLAKSFRPLESKYRETVTDFLLRRQGVDKSEKNKLSRDIEKAVENLSFKSDLNYATPSIVSHNTKKMRSYEIQSVIALNMAISELASDLKRKFTSLSYLGPLRGHPSRFYSPSGDQDESVGKQGENVPQFIYERSPEITKEINTWFESFEIPYILSVTSIGNQVSGPVICLQLEDKRTGVLVGPSDVGFGIGQILPVIVEGIVRDGSIICVEQPEIHLHPRLQAHLANFIVETCAKNQWIIETHSEAIMLRLQRLIRDKKVLPKDISIIYVDPTDCGGKIIRIELDEDGDFKSEWPDGFFDERLKELMRT